LISWSLAEFSGVLKIAALSSFIDDQIANPAGFGLFPGNGIEPKLSKITNLHLFGYSTTRHNRWLIKYAIYHNTNKKPNFSSLQVSQNHLSSCSTFLRQPGMPLRVTCFQQ